MNRKELLQSVVDQTGLSQKEARWFIDTFFEGITLGLMKDQRVEIRGFGIFTLVEREQATFLNPKNGKAYAGGKIKTILFKPTVVTQQVRSGG